MNNIYPKEFLTVGFVLLGLFFGLLFFYPYIQAEVLTNTDYDDFDQQRLCQLDSHPDFKKLKVITYERFRGHARIYCLFNDARKNYSLNLYLADNVWRVEYLNLLSEGLYWPIYY